MGARHGVVIVGAGPGGAATAHYLAKHGLDVLLLDKSDFPRDKTCGDGLTPRAIHILADMGLLEALRPVGCSIREAEVFAPKGHSVAATIPQHDSLPTYLMTVPRLILDNIICQRAVASGAQFQSPVHVSDIEQEGNGVVVKGECQGKSFSARAYIAIIATGANIKLLLRMGLLKQVPPMILASRAYFEGLTGLTGRYTFHLDGVPLPGYGWVFPLSDSSANLGAGVFHKRRGRQYVSATSQQVFKNFVQLPALRELLSHARQVGPVKGYPLRVDFATAPTIAERVMLVGEAAGLVNPLTGEGIDCALESGKMAAEQLVQAFETGDLSRKNLEAYDRQLRQHFQRMFIYSARMRDIYLNHLVINRLVHVASRRTDLAMLFMNIVLGNQDAAEAISVKTILKAALGQ